jgi:hypothetical protein
MVRSGALTRERIDGEVADVVAGKIAGRTSADQTVVVVLVGIGALDIALGAELLKQARVGASDGRSIERKGFHAHRRCHPVGHNFPPASRRRGKPQLLFLPGDFPRGARRHRGPNGPGASR